MGSGSWTLNSFANYTSTTKSCSLRDDGSLNGAFTAQSMYKESRLHKDLDPSNVIRECVENEEHPNTLPVILALDVTGSMGPAATGVATQLGKIMNTILSQVKDKDIEFLIMGIGDLSYDDAPIQMSQFESDIRIAEHLDKIYFEGGGGGNGFESYTAAWYMGLNHCKLDCWERGQKGIIITLGDEPLNPYLPKGRLERVTLDNLEVDVETDELYKKASSLFNIYHIHIDDGSYNFKSVNNSYGKYLDEEHLLHTKSTNVGEIISSIITKEAGSSQNNAVTQTTTNNNDIISW